MFAKMVNTKIQSITHAYFWLKEYHDSNPEKDWNPFYAVAGRPENDLDEHCGPNTTINNPTVDSDVGRVKISHILRDGGYAKIFTEANQTQIDAGFGRWTEKLKETTYWQRLEEILILLDPLFL